MDGDIEQPSFAYRLKPEERVLTVRGALIKGEEMPEGRIEAIGVRLQHFLKTIAHPAIVRSVEFSHDGEHVCIMCQVHGTELDVHDLATLSRAELTDTEGINQEPGSVTTNLSVPTAMRVAQSQHQEGPRPVKV